MNIKWIIVLVSLFATGADSGALDISEQRQLIEKRTALTRRIEHLKQEQDFLLFQKEFSTLDSKYLILDLAERKGQLKYKHVVLKDFQFTTSPVSAYKKIPSGALTLTSRVEKPRARMSLAFGKTLVIWSKAGESSGKKQRGIVYLTVKRKDLVSISYALEDGAQAYIIPSSGLRAKIGVTKSVRD